MHPAGTLLGGRYRLDERIGGGGMGEVWRGTDEVLGRTVAIKIMLPSLLDEPGFAERFRAEARTMARLTHPGVVNIYDYNSDGQSAFLVMEYIDGDPLSRTLARVGRLTAARTMALIAQAADALQAAHDAGIVHRDVKPGNLMVRANGTLVLTDFGVARSDLAGITGTGMLLGTASYLSPEQAAGQVATPASDVYGLGVVAYQCLAGRRPFEGDNPLEIAMKHIQSLPPPLPADIPPAVVDIVMRALAKDPADRWPSAAALAEAARAVAASLGPPAPGGSAAPATAPSSPAPGTPSGYPPSAYIPAQPGAGHQPAYAQPPTQQVHYFPSVVTVPSTAPTTDRVRRGDRPSPLAVAAAILFAITIVICAGLVGYLVRQMAAADGGLFSSSAYDLPIEGLTRT